MKFSDSTVMMVNLVMKFLKHVDIFVFVLLIIINKINTSENDLSKCLITGPGIIPHRIILPARYFFIHSTNRYLPNSHLVEMFFKLVK